MTVALILVPLGLVSLAASTDTTSTVALGTLLDLRALTRGLALPAFLATVARDRLRDRVSQIDFDVLCGGANPPSHELTRVRDCAAALARVLTTRNVVGYEKKVVPAFGYLDGAFLFLAHELFIFDVEELQTHGGSLRVFVRHKDDEDLEVSHNVEKLRETERQHGLDSLDAYFRFSEQVRKTKRDLLAFLIDAKRNGKSIAGYGAPGKGNTLLNYCGIRSDFIDYTVDRSPHKQGYFTGNTYSNLSS